MTESSEAPTKKAFWETLPGILTGVGTVLTALTGLLALFITQSNKKPAEPAPTAAVTEPVRTKPIAKRRTTIVQVAGVWRDMDLGNNIKVTQRGQELTTATYNSMTGQLLARGTGTLNDRTIRGQYRWYDGSTFTANLMISDDGQEMTGTYKNTYTGESGPIRLSR